MKSRLYCSVLALLAIGLVGCKHGSPVTLKKAPFQLPAGGWWKVENPEQGISIAAPTGWKIGAATTNDVGGLQGLGDAAGGNGDMANFAANMEKQNEEQAKQDVKELEKDGIYISVIEGSRPTIGEERTRFNVYKEKIGGNAQLEDAVKKINDDLTNEEAPTSVDLPIGKAMRVHSHVTLKDGGEVDRIYFGLASGENIYVVRFITEAPGFNLAEIADKTIQTLRIDK